MFLRIFAHLLPNARAWRITATKKLRDFFVGLSGVGLDVKTYTDEIWLDIHPDTTREISEWEYEFGLRNTGLTEQQRRDRLSATWRALGGQDPQYIQDTLQSNGFDVYIHEWWEPGTEPPVGVHACINPRNPLLYLRRSSNVTGYQVTCGNPAATCGNPAATCGSSLSPVGYPLVNKVLETSKAFSSTCGNPAATCGNPAATCGSYEMFKFTQRDYVIPGDSSKWPYFLYIGGQIFPETATVDPRRQDEFENLCLKLCPSQQWIGILVKYA